MNLFVGINVESSKRDFYAKLSARLAERIE